MKSMRWAEGIAHRSGFLVPILGLLAAVAGCSSIYPTSFPPAISGTTWSDRQLSEALAQRLRRFRTLRGLASVSYRGADGSGGFKEAILVQRPHRLRLETLSPLGAALIVTVDGEEMAAYDPRGGIFFTGRSSKENLLRLIQIPLELKEVTAILLGLPPVEVGDAWGWDGRTAFRGLLHGGEERIEFDRTLGAPVKWKRYDREGSLEVSATFSDFSLLPAGLFPLNISLQAPKAGRKLEIRYQDPEVNVAVSATLFVQQKPAAARELLLDSPGG